jgi:hypothetical protein
LASPPVGSTTSKSSYPIALQQPERCRWACRGPWLGCSPHDNRRPAQHQFPLLHLHAQQHCPTPVHQLEPPFSELIAPAPPSSRTCSQWWPLHCTATAPGSMRQTASLHHLPSGPPLPLVATKQGGGIHAQVSNYSERDQQTIMSVKTCVAVPPARLLLRTAWQQCHR